MLPPLAQYLKNRSMHSRAVMQFAHGIGAGGGTSHHIMKTNDNNSDILVVKLHGVAEVMNENKQLAAAKRAQSSGGMEPREGSRGRNNNT